MNKREDRFKLTRRAFLYSSGATLGAATVSFPAEVPPYSFLYVETIYEPGAGGQETLVGVRLKLRNANKDTKVMDLAAADFMPAGTAALPRIDLVGLSTPFRDAGVPVPRDTVLTIRVSGINLFNQTSSNGRVCAYLFTIAGRPSKRVGDDTVTWQIAMKTNAWVHPDRKQWLDFPIVGLGEAGSLALIDLMNGNAGFKLELGPGWVANTLSRIIGQTIVARGDHVAVLSADLPEPSTKTSSTTRAESRRFWFWNVRPIDNASLLTIYGGVVQFRSVRFGWGEVGSEEGLLAPAAAFEVVVGNELPPPAAFTADKTLISLPNGKVDFPRSRFSIRQEKTSELTLEGSNVLASWNTKSGMVDKSAPGKRMVEIAFQGNFALSLRSGGMALAKLEYANSPGLQLQPVERQWQLFADFPASSSKIGKLDDLVDLSIEVEAPEADQDDDAPIERIRSVGLGGLVFKQAPNSRGAAGVRFAAELRIGRVHALAMTASLAEVPATLAREADGPVFSRVSVVEPGIHPVLRLRDVQMPFGFGDAVADRAGHIYLDLPLSSTSTRPALDLPLDAAEIQVRRASDMLLLDFRLANMRLRSTQRAGAFMLVPDPLEKPDDLSPIGFPNEPVLRADFGPQHMAEQAFLRRDALAGGLPALDFQTLARILGEGWPTKLVEVFQTLRRGTRAEKREAKQSLGKLAQRAAEILNAGEEASDDLKSIKSRLEKADADIRNRVADFTAFAQLFNKANMGRWRFLWRMPPEDQRVYCGPDDLDPDAADFAWQLRSRDHLVIRRAKLIERLISVDGSYGDPAAITRPSLNGLPDEIQSIINGKDLPIAKTISFTPSLPDSAVQAVLKGKVDDEKAQREASALKERVAADYAEFRTRWRRAAEEFRTKIADADFLLAADFASVRWALFNRAATDPVLGIMRTVVQGIVSLTGEEDEPFPERSRARFSGTSRLAFRWPRRHEAGCGERVDAPFALSELLDWGRRDQLVTLRARGVRSLDQQGNLVRVSDQGEYLRLQGFEPGRDLSARSWMHKVYAQASMAPMAYETAIELPFRLQLSPAQDPTWVVPHRVEIQLTLEPGKEPGPSFGQPLWSVSLDPANPDPLLRAVWSDDFWPERFRNERDQLDKSKPLDPRDRDYAGVLNDYYGQPQRGAVAPWYRKQLRRQNGEVVDVVPEGVPPQEREFRASMDPYDRDQLVLETSVPGILVKRGIDPATGQVIEGGDSYSPPDGYEFIDVATEQLAEAGEQKAAKVTSAAFYAPRALSFRELRLTSIGGTLDLHTKFKPPVAADLLDGQPLFAAATLASWRHLAVIGRTVLEELEYAGYLFPFGHHASLVKVTERRYVQPYKTNRGPTSYLVQRLFIRCSDPVKSDWYDQPDGGRAWPVNQMKILTGETADLVDPLPGAPAREERDAVELANGRISLYEGRGLVFWPRTAPFKGAEVPFEFQIDGSGYAHRMPMIFVDNEAANDEPTLASLITYYNGLPSGATTTNGGGFFSSRLARTSPRVFDHGGATRRYGVPLEEGQTDYETQAWCVGVEGRPGDARTRSAEDTVTTGRRKVLRARSNYGFSPLLLATDQPPFYPFVQFAEIRLDRLARLIGERRGRECLVAFETGYLRDGFADPSRPPAGPEPMLGVLSHASLDVGGRGDRIGAIGRFAGRVWLIARKEGPLTRKDSPIEEAATYIDQPPGFGRELFDRSEAPQSNASPETAPAGNSVSVKKLLETVLGDADVKIFGSFTLYELINQAVLGLADAVPVVKEIRDYAGEASASLIEIVRGEVAPKLRAALVAVEKEFREAAIQVGSNSLELWRVYPDVANAMSGLDKSLAAFEQAADNATAATKLTAVVTAGKALLNGLERASRDPISPLKLELRRVLLSDLDTIDVIEKHVRDLGENPSKLGDVLGTAVQICLAKLGEKLDEQPIKAEIVSAITRLLPTPVVATGSDAKFGEVAQDVVAALYDGIVKGTFKPAAPKSLSELLDRLKQSDLPTKVAKAVVDSPALQAIKTRLGQSLGSLDGESRSYWSQVVFLRDELEATLSEIEELAKTVTDATELATKQRAEALKDQAGKDLQNIADKAARAVFGVDAYILAREANTFKSILGSIERETELGRKILIVVELLRHLDGLFLKGRFGKSVEATLNGAVDDERLKTVLGVILDGYATTLDLAEVFVEQSNKLVPVDNFESEIASAEAAAADLATNTGLDGIASSLQALVYGLDQTPGDVDARIGAILAELQDTLDKAAVNLKVAETPWLSDLWDRTSKLASDVTRCIADAVKEFGDSQNADVRRWAGKFFDIYDPILEQLHRTTRRAAIAIAQARFSMSGWRDLSSSPQRPVAADARLAIDRARQMPNLSTYREVASTFPRAELSAMLAAWSTTADLTFEALQDILPACVASAKALARLPEPPSGAGPIAMRTLKRTEAVLSAHIRRELLTARDRVFAAGESLAQATGGTSGSALRPAAKLVKTALEARERAEQGVVNYPFLQPIVDLVRQLSHDASQLPAVEAAERVLAASAEAGERLKRATDLSHVLEAVEALRGTLQLTGDEDSLVALRTALYSTAAEAVDQTRDLAAARAAAFVTTLKAEIDEAADKAEEWLFGQVFSAQPVRAALETLAKSAESVRVVRNDLLATLERDNKKLATSIGTFMQFLKLGPANVDATLLPAFLFVAVPTSSTNVVEEKQALLANYTQPKDLLEEEARFISVLAGLDANIPPGSTDQLVALRVLLGRRSRDIAAVQIVDNFRTVMDQILQANFASLVNFQAVRSALEDQLRRLLPTRVTTQLDYSVPLQPFPAGEARIFNPIGDGRFTVRSTNTVDFSRPGQPTFEANAVAVLAPFEIKLLGGFDAITLIFSEAKLTWKHGGEPHFSIDFVDFRIGSQLSFVDQLADALGLSAGGAFVKLAVGFPGIEAGYRIDIPAFTLGGVTFLNVGLSAGALLPFDKRPARFLAALSSREDPFVIVAGIWGGGGHFQLSSDGRTITGFDASFVFGGGGGVTYGPLTMVGRITVGVFIRKVGEYTEIAGDFFAGGSGRVAIFGISSSLTVTTGMTHSGDMFGSAVFRYSFSVAFAKVSFAVTVAKKESKGFGQQKQAALRGRQPYMVAGAQGAGGVAAPRGRTARLKVSTARQDTDYRTWQRYFSRLRPEGY
ncbi:hypothetical protein ABIA22_004669 [Sinorhizobium fredii]|uniref:hypothetical protein n=1 Tax=Rhizobium fredii TaxID=380 RepID=UPI003515605F